MSAQCLMASVVPGRICIDCWLGMKATHPSSTVQPNHLSHLLRRPRQSRHLLPLLLSLLDLVFQPHGRARNAFLALSLGLALGLTRSRPIQRELIKLPPLAFLDQALAQLPRLDGYKASGA